VIFSLLIGSISREFLHKLWPVTNDVNATEGSGDLWRARAYNGGLGAEPPSGSRAEPLVRRASPSEAESFTTFGRPTEAITFMPFAIFCKLATPNLGYAMSRQDLTKFYIWQIFSLPHLKGKLPLHYPAIIEELILAIYNYSLT